MLFSDSLLKYFIRRDRGWVLSLLMMVCLVYLPFLGSPFVFDDLPFFNRNGTAHSIDLAFIFNLRGLPYASLDWTIAIFSDAVPHFFHLGNALLHAANVILLFYLLRLLLGAVMSDPESNKMLIWGAWLGALVFACHPVAIYAVGYVVERSIVMATLFALVMQLAYVRGLLTGQKRWLVLAVVAYYLASFSKEHSILVPTLLAAQTLLLRAKIVAGRRELVIAWLAFCAIGLLVMLRVKGVFGTPYEPMAAHLFEQQGVIESTPILYLLSVLTQAGLFFKYLCLWLLPNPAWMSIDMREPFISSFAEGAAWLGGAGFIVYGFVAIRLLLRGGEAGLAGFALLYPWLLFMVEFSSIRVQEPFVLYRSYLWLPGMMLFFPLALSKLPSRKMLFGIGFMALLLVPLAWNRLWVFADNYRLWNDAVQLLRSDREAGADRIYYNRGHYAAEMHKWDDAIADFQRVVTISPQLAPLRYQLGMAYVSAKRYQEALVQFDAQVALKPDDGRAYFGKALALMGLHAKEQASQQLQRGCELGDESACTMAGWSSQKKN
jgi:tetratricopeptide (TPR) repeat protein